MKLRVRLFSLCLIAASAAAWSVPGRAEVFKWIDDKGVVNYGNQPPDNGKKATALDVTQSTLSVVPGLSQDALEREHQRNLEARIDQLEQDLYAQRVRAAMNPVALVTDGAGVANLARFNNYRDDYRVVYPILAKRPSVPHRPRVRGPRKELLPTLVRPPEHR